MKKKEMNKRTKRYVAKNIWNCTKMWQKNTIQTSKELDGVVKNITESPEKRGISMKPEDTLKRNKFYHCLEYDHDQTGDICLISCGFEQCDKGVCYGYGTKDCYCLHAVLSGTGTLHVNGQELHPSENQMFLLKEGEFAEYTADEENPWKYCWVGFKGNEAKSLCEQIGFTDGIYCIDSKTEITEFYNLIYRMHEKPEMNYANNLRRKGLLFEFLALAINGGIGLERNQPKNHTSLEVYVKLATEFIRHNYATITVNDVVEYVGFSRSYFSTLFKKKMGMSLQEYLMKCRIERGKELLGTTDFPIQEIAARTGYDNPLNFSRAFRQSCGVSPVNYRQSVKKKEEPNE